MHTRLHPTNTVGLTEKDVLLRRKQGLTNRVQSKMTRTNGQIIRESVFTLFNGFNLLIAICLVLVGAYSNTVFLLVILQNILFRVVQEIHAKNMVQNLYIIGSSKASVIRSGRQVEIPVEEMVLDDITMLDMGKQICADSIVVHGEIEVNESLLTGEADAILKLPGDTLLSGSFVVGGKCYAKVEHVGEDNFAAKLALSAKKHKRINSELLNSMRKVTKFTSYYIVPIAIMLFSEAYLMRSDTLRDAVVSTSAALLGMLPKGLVLLVSFSLIIGIVKLSKKKVLVQELHSIETLAHVDMLCLDKTGTITEGKMRVSDVYIIDEHALPIPAQKAISCFIGAMDDNNATFIALKEYFHPDYAYNPIAKTPFSSARKWSSVTFDDIGYFILGAPEKIIRDCEASLPSEVLNAQKSGKRILCFGYSPKPGVDGALPDIKLVAAIGLDDPIRKNTKETLAFFKQEGVKVKIISGDNALTVSSVAKQAGLEDFASYVDLSQIHTKEELKKAAMKYSVFGRVLPHQKSLLIKALQAEGHIVAMTGDGVNDVLALKEADCSIAMAAGSDAAKQVSQLVLLNSDFTALPDVMREGRRVVNNITRCGGIFFIKTIYSILLSLFACLTITPFLFTPIQITLFDVVIEGYTPFFLSFEPSHERIQGNLLTNVIQRALPYALLILLNAIAITALYPILGIPQSAAFTIMYYITGFAGIMAVIKACQPFNKLRMFLCTTTIIGLSLAIYLFADILHVQTLHQAAFGLLVGAVIFTIPLKTLSVSMVNRLFQKKPGLFSGVK